MDQSGSMATEAEQVMLGLAEQLRDAATVAGRADIVTIAQAAVARLTPAEDPAPPSKRDGANTVIKILDGLGL